MTVLFLSSQKSKTPEELDTRFAKFSTFEDDSLDEDDDEDEEDDEDDDLNLILDEDFRDSVPKAKSTDSALPMILWI